MEDYIDKSALNALCDSLALEPEDWHTDDLERLLIIRDGLYELRSRLRDLGDDEEHSVDRLLSAVDRLYADLERAFRELNQEELINAQSQVSALRRGPQISAGTIRQTVTDLQKEASEVLTTTHTSYRHIEINFLKIDRSQFNLEILRNVKLKIQRLSASVFAIKLSLEQTIVYQGIFKFLTDSADKIVDELKALIQQIRTTYGKATDLITELTSLAEKGSRFSRLVTEFLGKAFAKADRHEETVATLKVQTFLQSETILCAAVTDANHVMLATKHGRSWLGDCTTGRFDARFRLSNRAVFCMAQVNYELMAIGTGDGLKVVSVKSDTERFSGSPREPIASIATAQWGAEGSQGTIITGSRNGVLRRWTLAGQLSQFSADAYEEVGYKIHCLVINGETTIVATGAELVFVDPNMRTKRTMKLPFEVSGMGLVNSDILLLCGEGNITHVALTNGAYSRIITASDTAPYSCVTVMDNDLFYFGTEDGKVGVMELASGEELGSVDVGFHVRGIVQQKQKILTYGGDWESSNHSAAFLTREMITNHIAA